VPLLLVRQSLKQSQITYLPSTIEIIFKDNGLGGLEVVDNGAGVDPSNYEFLGKLYNERLSPHITLTWFGYV
jgi:DNA mismatch repair protein PMS2